MIRHAIKLGLVCILITSQGLAQKIDSLGMENSLSPYFSLPKVSQGTQQFASNESSNFDRQILNLHRLSLVRTRSSADNIEKMVSGLLHSFVSRQYGYSRATCGDSICELVMVFPGTDGNSEESRKTISEFYDEFGKVDNKLKLLGPSMILQGSNTNAGFSMLFYASKK